MRAVEIWQRQYTTSCMACMNERYKESRKVRRSVAQLPGRTGENRA
jgi:hypothetical protein